MGEEMFLRVQDKDGRGPFKPGFSGNWRDPVGRDFPSVMEEFGLGWRDEIPCGWHCGCAFRKLDQVRDWFSAHECERLKVFGYRLVNIAGKVLRESAHQAIIIRAHPLRWKATPVAWPHA